MFESTKNSNGISVHQFEVGDGLEEKIDRFEDNIKKCMHKVYSMRFSEGSPEYAALISPSGLNQITEYRFYSSALSKKIFSGEAKEIATVEELREFIQRDDLLEIIFSLSKKHNGIYCKKLRLTHFFEATDGGVAIILFKILTNVKWNSTAFYLVSYDSVNGISFMRLDETAYKIFKWFVDYCLKESEEEYE